MQLAWLQKIKELVPRMAALGFPPNPLILGGSMAAPFDFMGDTLRGMRGIFADMRRCPEKLLEAEEKAGRMQTETAIARCKARGANSVSIPLHRGSDGFISLPAFERFYWPQLKKMLLDLIEAGITPVVFWEGTWDQRLRYLAELPKGKTVGKFQQSDIFKVKEVLGDTMCIQGGMPVSMLLKSTAEEIREHTKKLCQVVGKGGGFIMSTDIGELEGCDPDLIQVWVRCNQRVWRLLTRASRRLMESSAKRQAPMTGGNRAAGGEIGQAVERCSYGVMRVLYQVRDLKINSKKASSLVPTHGMQGK